MAKAVLPMIIELFEGQRESLSRQEVLDKVKDDRRIQEQRMDELAGIENEEEDDGNDTS